MSDNIWNEFLSRFNEVKTDLTILKNWMDLFIEQIRIKEIQNLLNDLWQKIRKQLNQETFNIGQFSNTKN